MISFDATSLYDPILSMLNQDERAVFIIGGKPGVASIATHAPALLEDPVVGSLDGYGCAVNSVNRIIQSGADFVLCGMGCGHQENFLRALEDSEFTALPSPAAAFSTSSTRAPTAIILDGSTSSN